MGRLIVVIAAATLVGGVAWAVGAQTTGGVTPVKCMDSVSQTTSQSTTSTHWANVAGFSDHPIAIYPIAIDVSALVSGAPVEFRILSTNVGGQTIASKPGPTRFVPRGGPDSFAYQWIERDQVAATHSNFIRLQWRSPSGTAVQLRRGDMSLLYTTDACQGSA
jgi:muramidase (phage lysozyme)